MRRVVNRSLFVAAACGLVVTGCADDPFDLGQPRSCEIADQNAWVYATMQDLYLFSADMPEVDPTTFDSPADLVRELRVDPDRWSRVSDKSTTEALFQEGKFIGFGFRTKRDADDNVVIASVHEDSPAGKAGMRRGDVFKSVGGLTIAQLDEDDSWSEVYGEKVPGVVVPFVLESDEGQLDVTLEKDWIDIVTVPIHDVITVGERKIGYLFFQTFVAPAFDELDTAFAEFNEAGVTDVIVDVRYNGGGLISVSRHLTNLLVGSVADGQVSYQIRYNDNFDEVDTARKVDRVGHSLPRVDSVAFVTTGSSLSASELLINSVRAHTRVEIVGGVTGGKPVGSKHVEFCESVLAPITFELINAKEQGGYFDGLVPTCFAADDLSHGLGDPNEGSLAAAVSMVVGEGCPALPSSPQPAGGPAQRDDSSKMELGITELASWH